jgi:leader peptidase (prepilin peptidase)/N-methyltransferase
VTLTPSAPIDLLAARAAIGFLLGAIAGSFVATLILRWPQGRSVISGRSCCEGCGKPLRARELMPILSFLLSRGQCSRCGAAIDPLHLWVEVICALVGLLSLALQPGLSGPITAMLGWWLVALAGLDLRHHWLPDRLTLPLVPMGLAVALLPVGPDIWERAIGAWIGWQQIPFVLVGAGLVGLGAVALMRLRGQTIEATDRLPLGTLFAIAAWPIWIVASSLT